MQLAHDPNAWKKRRSRDSGRVEAFLQKHFGDGLVECYQRNPFCIWIRVIHYCFEGEISNSRRTRRFVEPVLEKLPGDLYSTVENKPPHYMVFCLTPNEVIGRIDEHYLRFENLK